MMAGIVPCANSDWRDAVKMGGIMKKMKKKKNVSRSEPEVLLNQVKQHKRDLPQRQHWCYRNIRNTVIPQPLCVLSLNDPVAKIQSELRTWRCGGTGFDSV